MLLFAAVTVHGDDRPPLMLAKTFSDDIDISHYWISEKLDGVRARWNGKVLISRGGLVFKTPPWFTAGFPKQAMDGELWLARQQYQQTVAIVRKQSAHAGWRQIKFMIFDLPDHAGIFSERVKAMYKIKDRIKSPYLGIIPQSRAASNEMLMQKFYEVIEKGGEGLMLHHEQGLYQTGRSNDLLKLKPYADAEAIVVGYKPGKGRLSGKMGAIKVRTEEGKEFFIGSGFSDKEREQPPAMGNVITYRYQGLTDSGIPRFAVFLRIRDEF